MRVRKMEFERKKSFVTLGYSINSRMPSILYFYLSIFLVFLFFLCPLVLASGNPSVADTQVKGKEVPMVTSKAVSQGITSAQKSYKDNSQQVVVQQKDNKFKYFTLFKDLLLILATLIALFYGLPRYKESVAAERSKWLMNLFQNFYHDENHKEIRKILEYDYERILGPILRKILLQKRESQPVTLDDQEKETLDKFDDYLNFFEFTLYLVSLKQLREPDFKTMFRYFSTKLFKYYEITNYFKSYDYETLASRYAMWEPKYTRYIFVYGTLMEGFKRNNFLRDYNASKVSNHAKIRGKLYKLETYPAAIESQEGDSYIHGELYLMTSSEKELLKALDTEEEYHIGDLNNSLYYRKLSTIILEESGQTKEGWVYYYNRPIGDAKEIKSGNYRDCAEIQNH